MPFHKPLDYFDGDEQEVACRHCRARRIVTDQMEVDKFYRRSIDNDTRKVHQAVSRQRDMAHGSHMHSTARRLPDL